MPSQLTYPGIYVEEVPSGVHPITGASTSDTAFVDYFARGPLNTAVRCTSLAEVSRRCGIDQPALSRLENGHKRNPTVETLWKYAAALGKRLVLSTEDVEMTRSPEPDGSPRRPARKKKRRQG